jgi:enoyl-CoA hydratase/carnithine racemase
VIELTWDDGVAVLRLDHGANAFDDAFVRAAHSALDEVEGTPDARALVTTGTAKYYSNGFDLTFLGGLERDALIEFLTTTEALLARTLTFPMPTVAAINGHAFGIGALYALAHDRRAMRRDRGWFCLPEVDLGMRFNAFQLQLIASRLPSATIQDATLTGRRYGGDDALAAGIVEVVTDEAALTSTAVALATAWAGKDRSNVAAMKRDLNAATLAAALSQTPKASSAT